MPRFRDTCSAAINCPWLRNPADAVATVKPAGSSGWMRADRAELFASRTLRFTFDELIAFADLAGASVSALAEALDFPATGESVSLIPGAPIFPWSFCARRFPPPD